MLPARPPSDSRQSCPPKQQAEPGNIHLYIYTYRPIYSMFTWFIYICLSVYLSIYIYIYRYIYYLFCRFLTVDGVCPQQQQTEPGHYIYVHRPIYSMFT